MNCRCQVLLLSLVLFCWNVGLVQAQWGWGKQPYKAATNPELASQVDSSTPWQQPVSVSINPQRPLPTVIQPLPTSRPAPTSYALPSISAGSAALEGSASGTPTALADSKPMAGSSWGSSSLVSSSSDQGSGSSSSSSGTTGTGHLGGAVNGNDNGSQVITEVIAQPSGTTVKLLPGRQAPAGAQAPQQVTIISIMPGAAGGTGGLMNPANQGTGGFAGGWGAQQPAPMQWPPLPLPPSPQLPPASPQQQQQVVTLPPLGDIQPGDLPDGSQEAPADAPSPANKPLAATGSPATAAAGTTPAPAAASAAPTARSQLNTRQPSGMEPGTQEADSATAGAVEGAVPSMGMQAGLGSDSAGSDPSPTTQVPDGGAALGAGGLLQPEPTGSASSSSSNRAHAKLLKPPIMTLISMPPENPTQQADAHQPADAIHAGAPLEPRLAAPGMQKKQQQPSMAQQVHKVPSSVLQQAQQMQQDHKPCGCPFFKFEFVCGADGLTYANPCMAACAGAAVAYTGPCEASHFFKAQPTGATIRHGGSAPGSSSSSNGNDVAGGLLLADNGMMPDSNSTLVDTGRPSEADTPEEDSSAADTEGDYEYYYEDGRPPVPAAPRLHDGAAPLPTQPAASLPAAGAPSPLPPPPSTTTVVNDNKLQDGIQQQQQPAQPPALPRVFGPESIIEDTPATLPVPPPLPIQLTSPAPPKDIKGAPPQNPIPEALVRAPSTSPTAPIPLASSPVVSTAPLSGPAPEIEVPDRGTEEAQDTASDGSVPGDVIDQQPARAREPVKPMQPRSGLAGLPTSHVKAPSPWMFKQEGAGETILIGCILPFEGDLRLAGNAIYHALKLAVSETAPKVLPDFNVNLTCINTKCADIPSHMAMERLAKDKAVAVIGEVCSAATVAAAGVSSSYQMPLISPAATSPALSGKDFFFRTVPSDKFQGQAAADLLSDKGYRNVALVYEDAAYGYGLAFNFIAAFTKEGGNVPVVLMFQKGKGKPKQDALQVKADIAAKELDAVFLSTNNLTYAAAFLRAAHNNNLGLRIFGGDALADPMMVTLLKEQPEPLRNLSLTTVNKGKNPFIRRFRSTFPDVAYGSFAAQGYDAMVALLRAYAAAQPPRDGQAVADELQEVAFEGVSGPVAFDKSGDAIPHNRTYMWVRHNTTSGVPVVKGYIP